MTLSRSGSLKFSPGSSLLFPHFACLRVERGILFATDCLARELDEVMRDEAHAQSRVDLPTAQRVAKRAPERASVVRQQSDMEHDVEGKRRRATQVDPGQLAAGGTDHPVHICGID